MRPTIFTLLLLAPVSFADNRPLPDNPAWAGYCECMTEDQIWFAKNF